MPRRTVCFTDAGIDPRVLTEDDKPSSQVHRELADIFREHKDRLTDRQWSVVEALYCFGMSEEAVAVMLGMTRQAVSAHAKRAMTRLARWGQKHQTTLSPSRANAGAAAGKPMLVV